MRALVTGGAGFLGKAIATRIVEQGGRARSFSRGAHPELEPLGIEPIQGNLNDTQALSHAAKGCDVVFHVAARVGGWGPREEFHRTNVDGTSNVIDGCQRAAVPKLVFTSTPSVAHAGGDIEGADESLPYAPRYEAAYPETKAEAERRVLAANSNTLATVALRPHLVWGPGDNHLMPRLLERARAGRLWLVGREDKLVDATYIDNAVDAHLRAAELVRPGAPCAGRAYFIAQGEPAPASELINGVLVAAGLPPVTRRIPASMAWVAGLFAEGAYRLLRKETEPPLTRFAARQLATAHWYDLSAARRDLGYAPKVTTSEGLARLRLHLESQSTGAEPATP